MSHKKRLPSRNEFMIGRRRCLVGLTAVGETQPRYIALAYDYAMSVPAGLQGERGVLCKKNAPLLRGASFWVGVFSPF
jgi:hypothetical protein